MCCCTRLHRHQIHLITYGIVSCGLITTGLVFTVFAIFQKDSQIGKVWLAGPTTMVVGLVLAGKVVIDWGPAMLHGRHGSVDSRFMEINLPRGNMNDVSQIIRYDQQPKCNGNMSGPIMNHQVPNYMSPRLQRTSLGPPRSPQERCLIYSQYSNSVNNIPMQQMTNHDRRPSSSNRRYTKSPDGYPQSSNTNNSDNSAEQSIALTEFRRASAANNMGPWCGMTAPIRESHLYSTNGRISSEYHPQLADPPSSHPSSPPRYPQQTPQIIFSTLC